jgi:lysosomal acid lipase/cholesteryl ester hydrolase
LTFDLGYVLSDEGFDVWLGNTRGSRYSLAHTFLNNNQKEFWDFSWHEVGYYDLPTMIDYILQTTQQKQLNYVGYSEVCKLYFQCTCLYCNELLIKTYPGCHYTLRYGVRASRIQQ